MSDRIKKIKIKQADGTMTDYIPIGVDAENVEVANQENLSQRLARIDEDLEKNEKDIAAVSELASNAQQTANTANTNATNANTKIDELNLKDTIMIGDSFIQMFPSDNWALSLKNKLGLSDNQVYIFGEGGAGMFNPRKCWT